MHRVRQADAVHGQVSRKIPLDEHHDPRVYLVFYIHVTGLATKRRREEFSSSSERTALVNATFRLQKVIEFFNGYSCTERTLRREIFSISVGLEVRGAVLYNGNNVLGYTCLSAIFVAECNAKP